MSVTVTPGSRFRSRTSAAEMPAKPPPTISMRLCSTRLIISLGVLRVAHTCPHDDREQDEGVQRDHGDRNITQFEHVDLVARRKARNLDARKRRMRVHEKHVLHPLIERNGAAQEREKEHVRSDRALLPPKSETEKEHLRIHEDALYPAEDTCGKSHDLRVDETADGGCRGYKKPECYPPLAEPYHRTIEQRTTDNKKDEEAERKEIPDQGRECKQLRKVIPNVHIKEKYKVEP